MQLKYIWIGCDMSYLWSKTTSALFRKWCCFRFRFGQLTISSWTRIMALDEKGKNIISSTNKNISFNIYLSNTKYAYLALTNLLPTSFWQFVRNGKQTEVNERAQNNHKTDRIILNYQLIKVTEQWRSKPHEVNSPGYPHWIFLNEKEILFSPSYPLQLFGICLVLRKKLLSFHVLSSTKKKLFRKSFFTVGLRNSRNISSVKLCIALLYKPCFLAFGLYLCVSCLCLTLHQLVFLVFVLIEHCPPCWLFDFLLSSGVHAIGYQGYPIWYLVLPSRAANVTQESQFQNI